MDPADINEGFGANAVLLTLAQTRHLGNFSPEQGLGFVNVRLSPAEFDQLRTADHLPATFSNPAYLPGNDMQTSALMGMIKKLSIQSSQMQRLTGVHSVLRCTMVIDCSKHNADSPAHSIVSSKCCC